MDNFLTFDWSFIDQIGDNPFYAMWYFFLHGGWVFILWVLLWGALQMWVGYRQGLFNAKKSFVVLAISIPRMHEQGPRAMENAFAYLAGAHSASSWTEKWIIGRTQDTISVEIISIDGQVQFMVRTTSSLRDLVEGAIYSQYSDAEIIEVEDYAMKVPAHYPDEEWDMWGTELIPVKSDIYPLRTYPAFEDKVSGEFKDPLSGMLEGLSRLHAGEQAWFQIVLNPIAQSDFHKKADLLVKKLKGEKVEAKKTMLDHTIDLPLKVIDTVVSNVIFAPAEAGHAKKDQSQPRIMAMTQGEKDIIGAIENKASKIVYLCKIRFLYVAKKDVLSKSHIVQPFIGAIKQFNTNNMQALKPETKKVGVNGALWWFKAQRNNERKAKLVRMYRARSTWQGTQQFHLCTEELASLWHFPHSMQVKSPQLKKTEAKRSEPPINIPFE